VLVIINQTVIWLGESHPNKDFDKTKNMKLIWAKQRLRMNVFQNTGDSCEQDATIYLHERYFAEIFTLKPDIFC
jgi:hypothetical protein